MGQSELLERAVADVRGQIPQLVVELPRQRLLELLADLAVDPPEVIHGAGLGADPPSLLEDLAGDAGDPEELLGIHGPGSRQAGAFRRGVGTGRVWTRGSGGGSGVGVLGARRVGHPPEVTRSAET